LEIQQTKISTQVTDLQKLNTENIELKTILEQESTKNGKLLTIASGKYKMDTSAVDNYMPKGPAYKEKLKSLAANLI
jgi:hypothetical protein